MPHPARCRDAPPAFYLPACPPVSAGLFELRPPGLPADAHPLHDPLVDAVIGYAHRVGEHLWIIDLDGQCVSSSDAALDPGTAATLRARLRQRFAALLRAAPPLAVSPAQLRDAARFVPTHILTLAIRHGEHLPDCAGHPGVSRYAAALVHNGHAYRLDLAVRDHDATVLHVSFSRHAPVVMPIRVDPLPVTQLGRASALWDRDCLTLLGAVMYPRVAAPLSDTLELRFDTPPGPRVIVADALTLTLDERGRLSAFDFYTNPARWRETDTLSVVRPAAHGACFAGAFDPLGRASVPEPVAWHARDSRTLRLVWQDAVAWYAIAPGLSVAVSEGGALAQLNITGFPLPGAGEHDTSSDQGSWAAHFRQGRLSC
jgi:hypothetical protein